MHVIRDKSDRRVLHIDHRRAPQALPGKAVYPGFDPDRMEVGWTDGTHIPAYFDIDASGRITALSIEEATRRDYIPLRPHQKWDDGKLVSKSEDELLAEGLIDLGALKAQLIDAYSKAAFDLRARLIPDYRVQNAALGVYDHGTVAQIRATIAAFRAEFYRLKTQVEKASSLTELRSIEPKFPEALTA